MGTGIAVRWEESIELLEEEREGIIRGGERGLPWYEKGVVVDWEESKELLEEEGVVAISWEGKWEEEGEGVVEVGKLDTGGWQGWEVGLRIRRG